MRMDEITVGGEKKMGKERKTRKKQKLEGIAGAVRNYNENLERSVP